MNANIRDAGQCNSRCPRRFEPSNPVPATEGDVRKCPHGRLWYCTGNTAGHTWMVEGYWYQLHPIWDWSRYRRAKRVIAAAATPDTPRPTHP